MLLFLQMQLLTFPKMHILPVLYMFYWPFITTVFSPGPTLFNTWLMMLSIKTTRLSFTVSSSVFDPFSIVTSAHVLPSKQIFGPTTSAAPLVMCKAKRSAGQTMEELHFGSAGVLAESADKNKLSRNGQTSCLHRVRDELCHTLPVWNLALIRSM